MTHLLVSVASQGREVGGLIPVYCTMDYCALIGTYGFKNAFPAANTAVIGQIKRKV